MAKVKGLKKIKKVVNEFTQTFGVKAVWNVDFEAHPELMRVGFTIVVDSDLNSIFLQDCEERFPEIHTNLFIWLLMHEIGHCMTEGFWSDEDSRYFLATKDRTSEYFGYFLNENDPEETFETVQFWVNDIYHAMPDEYLATNWAGNYMKKHPKKMAKFAAKINEAIKELCEKNGITP